MWADLPRYEREAGRLGGEVLMQRFIEAVAQGRPPPMEMLHVFSDAFSRILEGDDPAQALGLVRPPGRRPATVDELRRRIGIVIEVLDAQAAGARYEDAVDQAAGRYHKTANHIGKLVAKHRLAAQVEIAARDRRPLPEGCILLLPDPALD